MTELYQLIWTTVCHWLRLHNTTSNSHMWLRWRVRKQLIDWTSDHTLGFKIITVLKYACEYALPNPNLHSSPLTLVKLNAPNTSTTAALTCDSFMFFKTPFVWCCRHTLLKSNRRGSTMIHETNMPVTVRSTTLLTFVTLTNNALTLSVQTTATFCVRQTWSLFWSLRKWPRRRRLEWFNIWRTTT